MPDENLDKKDGKDIDPESLPVYSDIFGDKYKTKEAERQGIQNLVSKIGKIADVDLDDLHTKEGVYDSWLNMLGNPDTFDQGVKEIYEMFDRTYPTEKEKGDTEMNDALDVDNEDTVKGSQLKDMIAKAQKEASSATEKKVMALVGGLLKDKRMADMAKKEPLLGHPDVVKAATEIDSQLDNKKVDPDEVLHLAAIGRLAVDGKLGETVQSGVKSILAEEQLRKKANTAEQARGGGDGSAPKEITDQERYDAAYDKANPRHSLTK